MTARGPRSRRSARYSKWAATGLTAAVAVGSVGAMADASQADVEEDHGAAIGAVARYQAEVALAEMIAAADPGDDTPAPPPPRIGSAGVS